MICLPAGASEIATVLGTKYAESTVAARRSRSRAINKARLMDPEVRQQISDAVEAWSQEHWNQRWARAMEIVEQSPADSGAPSEYRVSIELSDMPDWMTVLVRSSTDGQLSFEPVATDV